MSTPPFVYAHDEDVALFAPSDFSALGPPDQKRAGGDDGVFDSADRWSLTSASVDFSAAGLRPGHVVRLTAPTDVFPTPGALFGVSSVAGTTVTLKRLGLPSGEGAPPAPEAGLSGVAFQAVTLDPQIETAGRELERRLGLDESVPGRRPSELAGEAPLREIAVRLVLIRRYTQLARDGDSQSPFQVKAEVLRRELDAAFASLSLRWKGAGPGGPATRPSFNTRLVR